MFKRIKKVVCGLYKDVYKYVYFPPFGLKPLVNSEKDWFISSRTVPHAFGLFKNNKYTNSKEALEFLLENNVNISEVDICLTKDNIPVLAHEIKSDITYEDFMSSTLECGLTPLSLFQLVEYMRKNKNLFFLLDIKEKYKEIITWIKNNANDVIDRFIIQIPSPKIYKNVIKIHKFKYFHYNFSVDGNVNMNLAFVVKNNIQTCSVATKMVKNVNTLKYLNKYNIKTFAYTVNDAKTRTELFKKGVWGIITDNLTLE